MKCTTLQYIANLKGCCDSLKEIIAILGPIRVDAEEGAMGLKAKHALEKLEEQLQKLEKQTQYTTGHPVSTFNFSRTENRFNRKSVCL